MRRVLAVLGAVALAAALSFPVSAGKPARGYQWQDTFIEVWDATPFPALVDTVVANWNVIPGLTLTITQRLPDCGVTIPQGVILICADFFAYPSVASWAEPNLTGGRKVIKSAFVGINLSYGLWLDPDPALNPTRQYLMCHETGGALGLVEARWPAVLPNGTLDAYHHGCMNLEYQSPTPSQYDIDILTTTYG